MKFDNIKYIYLIGIGGIGMSALARYFNSLGKKVAGYDKTPTPLTDELIKEGINIHFDDDISKIPLEVFSKKEIRNTLVIYTPAIPANHSELNYFSQNNYELRKRSEVLGMISRDSKTIAVGGTHGKTTTSSMVAHILKSNGINCAGFLGGISKNFNNNFLLPEAGKEVVTVVEADEYDRSFLQLLPYIAVITSMDADHMDIYEDKNYLDQSYRQFAELVSDEGMLIYNASLPLSSINRKKKTYSAKEPADFYAENIRVENHCFVFDFTTGGKRNEGFSLQLPGRHNVENAVAACAVAITMGIEISKIKQSLASYTGVKRRFDFQFATSKTVFIDDYAHHPEELNAAISAVKELYPGRKITGIFQPHLFSRTRDFADEFAQSLGMLDEVILLEIYPARELPVAGINSQWLLDKILIPDKKLFSKQETLHNIKSRNDLEVLITLGAGDIDQLIDPIRNILIENNKEK